MITLRITPTGRIRGLWTDAVPLTELGPVHVRRASHVEFDHRRQCWTVRPAVAAPPTAGPVVHQSNSRTRALAWEHEHFQPGGRFWEVVQAAAVEREHAGRNADAVARGPEPFTSDHLSVMNDLEAPYP